MFDLSVGAEMSFPTTFADVMLDVQCLLQDISGSRIFYQNLRPDMKPFKTSIKDLPQDGLKLAESSLVQVRFTFLAQLGSKLLGHQNLIFDVRQTLVEVAAANRGPVDDAFV